MNQDIFLELPSIEVDKNDLPYIRLIRQAFNCYEICGAVKFTLKDKKSFFSGYNKEHYETESFLNRILPLKKHHYTKKETSYLVSNGSEQLDFNVRFGEYIKQFQSNDQYLKYLDSCNDEEYTLDHVKSALKRITSKEEYIFIYSASRAQSASNTCGSFHFNNFYDLLSNIESRDAYISGINSPFVYYNVSGVFFPFHRDPIGTGVCNINCYGKPNIWFLIPPQNVKIFMLYI